MSSSNNLINKYGGRNKGRSIRITSDNTIAHSTKIPTCEVIKKDNAINTQIICEEVKKKYNNSLEEYWKKRTDQPYKNILYDRDYSKPITKEEDLIISKTNNIQKINDEQINEYRLNIKKHNDELKNIYSLNKEQEHFKQFEYNLKHKYRIMDPVTNDQTSIKNERILYYKKEQEKLDQIKDDKEKLFNGLLQNGIFNEDELKEFGGINL